MSGDLLQRVRSDLDKQGYPLEMRTARAFEKLGWRVELGRLYTDSSTGKQRDIDVVASKSAEKDREALVTVEFVVECKQSRDKPWVGFASPVSTDRFFMFDSVVTGELSARTLDALIASSDSSGEFFKPSGLVWHGISRAFGDSKDGDPTAPYAAVRGAVSASAALAAEAEERIEKLIDAKFAWPTITVPLVVVDGPMVQYTLDGDGNDSLALVRDAWVQTHHHNSSYLLAVRVVAFEALEEYLSDITPRVARLAEALTHQAKFAIHVYRAMTQSRRATP